MVFTGQYLILDYSGLGIFGRIDTMASETILIFIENYYANFSLILATWILLLSLIHLIRVYRRGEGLIVIERITE